MPKQRSKQQTSEVSGNYVIYTITVANIATNEDISIITDRLKVRGIPGSYQHITPATEDGPGSISIPRLCTFWQGDMAEKGWQENLDDPQRIAAGATVKIHVAPWAPAPGYPMGVLAS